MGVLAVAELVRRALAVNPHKPAAGVVVTATAVARKVGVLALAELFTGVLAIKTALVESVGVLAVAKLTGLTRMW